MVLAIALNWRAAMFDHPMYVYVYAVHKIFENVRHGLWNIVYRCELTNLLQSREGPELCQRQWWCWRLTTEKWWRFSIQSIFSCGEAENAWHMIGHIVWQIHWFLKHVLCSTVSTYYMCIKHMLLPLIINITISLSCRWCEFCNVQWTCN